MNIFHFFLQNHEQILELTLEHLWLVGISTLLAVSIGIPLGILSAHWPVWNRPVLGTANIIQTIPSLALFGFLLPVPWLGERADRLAILRFCPSFAIPTLEFAESIQRWWKPGAAWDLPSANFYFRSNCRWR
jgi:osmoprotectant transport system permease protein